MKEERFFCGIAGGNYGTIKLVSVYMVDLVFFVEL